MLYACPLLTTNPSVNVFNLPRRSPNIRLYLEIFVNYFGLQENFDEVLLNKCLWKIKRTNRSDLGHLEQALESFVNNYNKLPSKLFMKVATDLAKLLEK